ncbi:hypothetical protein QUF79_01715 [Fictibacillus enclensis]|uniref:hypothetical protein n=1 Tax=Fictibacillus enclensis TaxID=1017270 RepID=UPI0025A2F76C|nr:hypothetical protein [Fictibacillus enclensis]MDM5196797.1 hypothetical protein [Fictibacillus enclensis]
MNKKGDEDIKKLRIAVLLLLISLAYLLYRLGQETLYLSRFSMHADNPVSLHWNRISLDTQLVKGDPGSIYEIWMTPVYGLILIVLILTILSFKNEKKGD